MALVNASGLFDLARERYRIKLRKEGGYPWPWTDDPLLRDYHTCNVFRDDDAVSRLIMKELMPTARVPWVTAAAARLVNEDEAIRALLPDGNLAPDWSERLQRIKLNTHAYKINTPEGLWSRVGIEKIIHAASVARWEPAASLQEATSRIWHLGVGWFVAYQAAQDLKGTAALPAADDLNTWAYCGTGAVRGALRLTGFDVGSYGENDGKEKPHHLRMETMKDSWTYRAVKEHAGIEAGWEARQRWVLAVAKEVLEESRREWPAEWPAWEMSEAESMLCDYDKMCRWRHVGPVGRRYRVPLRSLFKEE